MAGEIRRERGAEARERQMVNAVRGRFHASDNAFQSVFQSCARRYDLYRGTYTGRFHPHRNNLHIPLGFSIIQSDVSHKVQATAGRMPYVNFEPGGPEDADTARRQTSLVAAQMKDTGFYRTCYDAYLSADIYGVTTMMTGYETKIEDKKVFVPVTDPYTGKAVRDSSGRILRTLETHEGVIVRDRPTLRVIDILDSFPQPGVPRIEEMDWFIVRHWLDADTVRLMAREGIYDPISEDKLSKILRSNHREAVFAERGTYSRNQFDEPGASEDPLARPVEIWEMWGSVPDELVPPNGTKMRVVTLANGVELLRNRDYPYFHGRLPFRSIAPFQDPHSYHSPGKLEIVEKMQMLANRLASQKADIIDLVADPVMIARRDAGVDVDSLYARPGNVIFTDDDITSSIRPWIPDLRGVDHIYPELQQLWAWMQQSTGTIEDTVMGGTGVTKRLSATEFSGRQQAVANRILLEIRLAEEQAWEPIATDFRDLDRQFLTTERQSRILGLDAQINPVTSQRVSPVDMLGPMDLDGDYDARATGSTALTKDVTTQKILTAIQIFGTVPPMMAQINWENMARQVFESLEFGNALELTRMSPEQMALQMQAMGALGREGTGGSRGTSTAVPNGTPSAVPNGTPSEAPDPMTAVMRAVTGG